MATRRRGHTVGAGCEGSAGPKTGGSICWHPAVARRWSIDAPASAPGNRLGSAARRLWRSPKHAMGGLGGGAAETGHRARLGCCPRNWKSAIAPAAGPAFPENGWVLWARSPVCGAGSTNGDGARRACPAHRTKKRRLALALIGAIATAGNTGRFTERRRCSPEKKDRAGWAARDKGLRHRAGLVALPPGSVGGTPNGTYYPAKADAGVAGPGTRA